MAKDYRKKISFQAGEISPRLFGRTDSEFYQKGLETAQNVIIDKRGGAFSRNGMRNRYKFPSVINQARVFIKQIHAHRFDVLMLQNNILYVVGGGLAYDSANLLSSPNFKYGAHSDWTVTKTTSSKGNVFFHNNIAEMVPEQSTNHYVEIRQQVTVTASTSASHTVEVHQAITSHLEVKIGTTAGASDIASVISDDERISLAFVPNNATYYVSIRSTGILSERNLITFAGTIATADLGFFGQQFTTGWVERDLEDMHIVPSPDGNEIYFLEAGMAPRKLSYDPATNTYTFATVTFTAPPAAWAANNYPATGIFFQGRLWLGGTPNEPETFWASKSGSPEDFTTGSGDADSFNLVIDRNGAIKWMEFTKDLVIGTENSEHVVTSSAGVITQSDFQIEQQSAYGSNILQAERVGEKVFYISPDGERVQSMGYEWEEDNWLSLNVNFASEHLTEKGIRRKAWAQNPNSLFYAVLQDGTLVTLTFDRTADTIGWSYGSVTDAEIIDVAIGYIAGKSRLVTLSRRTVDIIDCEIEQSNSVYLDSYSHTYHDTPSNTLSGLAHLNGEEVQVVVDGAVDPPKTVSGGSITTTTSGNSIYAGKAFTAKIKTLPPDIAAGQEQIRSWKKRWNRLWALMYQSAAPVINGVRSPDRSPGTPMGTPEPYTDASYQVTELGWDDNAQVTIEQDQPVPMNVLAVYGDLNRETL